MVSFFTDETISIGNTYMAITKIPKELQRDKPLVCSICRVNLLLSKATAGPFNSENCQCFACVSHFSEVELLITGWADFMATERFRYECQKRKAEAMGAGNAWLNS